MVHTHLHTYQGCAEKTRVGLELLLLLLLLLRCSLFSKLLSIGKVLYLREKFCFQRFWNHSPSSWSDFSHNLIHGYFVQALVFNVFDRILLQVISPSTLWQPIANKFLQLIFLPRLGQLPGQCLPCLHKYPRIHTSYISRVLYVYRMSFYLYFINAH